MQYDHIQVPANGESITANRDHSLNVPDYPIIPFIEGDGIGADVTPVMLDVVNAATALAYGDARQIRWMQVYAGQAAMQTPRRMAMKQTVARAFDKSLHC